MYHSIKLPQPVNGVISIDSSDENFKIKAIALRCMMMERSGVPFTLSRTGNTYELESKKCVASSFRKTFSPESLNFISAVKRYVKKSNVALNFIDFDFKTTKIEYIKVNKFKPGDELRGLRYIDITKAYWNTAYQLGVIDQKLYDIGAHENFDKVVRLAALGSLARSKSVWHFDGKVYKKLPSERSWDTENIWFAICKKVSDVMNEVARKLGDDFVFYWVDGIYVKARPGVSAEVAEIFGKHGYDVTDEAIPKITFEKNHFRVHLVDSKENEEVEIQKDDDEKTKTHKDFFYTIGQKKKINSLEEKLERIEMIGRLRALGMDLI